VIKILIALCDEKTFASALNEISKSGKVSPKIKEWLDNYHESGTLRPKRSPVAALARTPAREIINMEILTSPSTLASYAGHASP
jgi:hypothetical protein